MRFPTSVCDLRVVAGRIEYPDVHLLRRSRRVSWLHGGSLRSGLVPVQARRRGMVRLLAPFDPLFIVYRAVVLRTLWAWCADCWDGRGRVGCGPGQVSPAPGAAIRAHTLFAPAGWEADDLGLDAAKLGSALPVPMDMGTGTSL